MQCGLAYNPGLGLWFIQWYFIRNLNTKRKQCHLSEKFINL